MCSKKDEKMNNFFSELKYIEKIQVEIVEPK